MNNNNNSQVSGNGSQAREMIKGFTLEDFLKVLAGPQKILVVTGAGISTGCGIPDFRSANGLYKIVEEMDLDVPQPECVLDLEYFLADPQAYYAVAPYLQVPEGTKPSLMHRWLGELDRRKKLLRNYTQNIDGLELRAGVRRVVQCHGTLATASCLSCKARYGEAEVRAIQSQHGPTSVPACPKCGPEKGALKPDIVMFGEALPAGVKRALTRDLAVCGGGGGGGGPGAAAVGALVVAGTSLQVAPVSRIVQAIHPSIPQVLINRDCIRPNPKLSRGFDLNLIGECDVVVRYLCERLGWLSVMEHHMERNKKRKREPLSGKPSTKKVQIPDPKLQWPSTYIFGSINDDSKGHCSEDKPPSFKATDCWDGLVPAEENHQLQQEVVTCDICSRKVHEVVPSPEVPLSSARKNVCKCDKPRYSSNHGCKCNCNASNEVVLMKNDIIVKCSDEEQVVDTVKGFHLHHQTRLKTKIQNQKRKEKQMNDNQDFEEAVKKDATSMFYSCSVCFDFDLCVVCYDNGANFHSQTTKHRFTSELIDL